MTEEEFEAETMIHINNVRKYIYRMIKELLDRAENHDASKLEEPERSTFLEFTPKLKGSTYGSDEYNGFLKQMQTALDHHYAENRHHPEHFKNGVNDMSLLDLFELFADWKAATLRHADGDIHKSIKQNTDRFGLSPQIVQIFENTVEVLENGDA